MKLSGNPLADPKWRVPESSTLSALTRKALFAAVDANLERLGPDGGWSDLVDDPEMSLFSVADGERVAKQVVDEFEQVEGRKLYAGCEAAVVEHPDLYVLRSAVQELVPRSDWPAGVIGEGDNVFRSEDVEGEVLIVREVSQVDRLMNEGVPDGIVAVIDDAGGTMTAPIIGDFSAVLCLAGTVRSHLAIISREMGVPVLMGVQLRRALENGERVQVTYSVEGQNVDAYFGDEIKARAEIIEVAP